MSLFSSWIFWSLITSLAIAGVNLYIEFFSRSTKEATFWRGLGTGVILLPLPFFMSFDADIIFFLCLLTISILAVFADNRMYTIIREYGGGVAARITPLMVFLTFFMSLVSHPENLYIYTQNPLISGGIVASILCAIYCASHLRSCEVSKKAYLYALIPLISYAACNILAKISLHHADPQSGSFYYVLIQGWFMGICTVFLIKDIPSGKKSEAIDFTSRAYLLSKRTWLFGLGMGVVVSIMMISRNFSYLYAFDVSYPVMIQLLAPFWISLFYVIIKRKEETRILPGFGIVLAAIALTFFASQLG